MLLTRQQLLPRLLSLLAAALPVPLLPGCGVGYILSSGYYQADLLARREPTARVLAAGGLSTGEEQRLRLIPLIKAYGKEKGLAATDNYDTLAVGWDHAIWNLSACDPLAFEPVTWWFPVVGRVPYLGYFEEPDVRAREADLRERGYDVHVRTAGAYSTLGWFRDPVLPGMLRWSEADLAETVFHELAHATLWVPGSVAFNESFASFVGEAMAHAYVTDTYGAGSPNLAALEREERDWGRFEGLLHGLYRDLDTLYRDPSVLPSDKASRKDALYATLEGRAAGAGLEDLTRTLRSIRSTTWNNARLMQFRTYNSNDEWFRALYVNQGNDVRRFIDEVARITRGRTDPFVALQAAAGAPVQNP